MGTLKMRLLSWECVTFVITDGEVCLPNSLLCKAKEEAVPSERLVGVHGAHSLYPLEQETVE